MTADHIEQLKAAVADGDYARIREAAAEVTTATAAAERDADPRNATTDRRGETVVSLAAFNSLSADGIADLYEADAGLYARTIEHVLGAGEEGS